MLFVKNAYQLVKVALFAALFMSFQSAPDMRAQAASEIKYIVNGVPVTNYDIARRAAFLKLQHKKGNLTKLAGEEMIDQTLRQAEMKRLGVRISDDAVNAAFARFAQNNKMTPKQLAGIMNQAGVTEQHFKEYIRTQMGWNQALSARYKAQGGAISEQDAVRRMLQQGGAKPSATEYTLQQVIFVVPAGQKSLMAQRKRDADALRSRFNGCASTRDFTKGLVDVTVRDLGRVLVNELPSEWAEQIKSTKVGGATATRQTDRGIEFIGICNSREVSDDRVTKLAMGEQGSPDKQAEELDKKYMEDLHKRAKITER